VNQWQKLAENFQLALRAAFRLKSGSVYMMTSTQIRPSSQVRKDFLDFFKSKQHTIVPSSSLMPDSPNLLFTNAGMNQFVPIFLGQTKCPYTPGRAADTQKCIRAGGKHNDLDDVGLDTYHHTFFEMLGNWSFGDYFKKEAINWAWELIVEIWKFPPQRLYATVYSPDKSKNDPSEFDQDAWNFWAEKFRSVGLDPAVHIVNGNKKDNFWMMGETGPCGPCSELHVDLTPDGGTKGSLVNKGDARCIEIWNLVFIQFNAQLCGGDASSPKGGGSAPAADATGASQPLIEFVPLAAKHVDTGMGFERVTSIIQGTKGLTDFANTKISNYEADIFRPIFDVLEKMSGKTYRSTLPGGKNSASGLKEAVYSVKDDAKSVACHAKNVTDDAKCPADDTKSLTPDVKSVADQAKSVTGHAPSVTAHAQSVANEAKSFADDQISLDIAFRVIADHIRTLSFAIADGIQPGNNDRNYVLRRILRRAVRYGRTLGFKEPFFYKLVDVLADTMGDVFPEIRARKKQVQETIRTEEEAFNKTLDKGINIFEAIVNQCSILQDAAVSIEPHITKICKIDEEGGTRYFDEILSDIQEDAKRVAELLKPVDSSLWSQLFLLSTDLSGIFSGEFQVAGISSLSSLVQSGRELPDLVEALQAPSLPNSVVNDLTQKYSDALGRIEEGVKVTKNWQNKFPGEAAFLLYDTYGFPLDLTELMARERGLKVQNSDFERLMERQRTRARAAQKKEVIEVSQVGTKEKTVFVGYEKLETYARVLEVVSLKDKTAVILDTSACYAEMGGQVGDTGELTGGGQLWRVVNTQKSGNTFLHFVEDGNVAQASRLPGGAAAETAALLLPDSSVTLTVDKSRRDAIQRHHTVTHLLHWALHEVASKEASQKGSFVGPDKLTFDFNSAPLTPQQVADVEKLVNERILENAGVSWTEVPHADVKNRKDVMQFFGDKYGDVVRVVQIGGGAGKLDGYSMELCGGTHTRATGEIGLFRIVGESAIAAGVRRIEAVAGLEAYRKANDELHLIKTLAGKVGSPVHELDKKIEAVLAHQKELEKQLKSAQQREASNAASELLERVHEVNGVRTIIHNVGAVDGDFLQAVADSLKGRFQGVIILGGAANGAVALVATVSPFFVSKYQAGKIIQQIAPIVGGKGGGKPDNARGGGKDAGKLDEALAKAKSLI
jgi:alanyl-tRNA synthetase